MKYLVFILLFLLLLAPAGASDITVTTVTIPNFNVTGLPPTVTGTATVTNGSATVTSSAAFPQRYVGLQGYKIVLGGFEYEALSTASTSSLTLTLPYEGASGSVAFTLYPVVLLQIYSDTAFQPLGKDYIVQSGAPDSQGFYKRYACSVKSFSGVPSVVIPTITLDAISDTPNNAHKGARLAAYFYRVEGGRLRAYDGFQSFTLTASPTTQTWGDILRYNTATARAFIDSSTLTREQIYAALNNRGTIAGTYRRLGLISSTGAAIENSALYQDGSGNVVAEAALATGGAISSGGNITTSGDLIGATPEYTTAGRPTCNAANVRRRIKLTDGYEGIQTCVNTQGSVYEWVNDKQFVDVMDIGASASSSAAVNGTYLNVALDRVGATSGGRVKIPCGTFSYDTTLTVESHATVIEGEGTCTKLIYTGSGNAINVNQKQRVKILNLQLEKNGTRGNIGVVLDFACHYFEMRGVWVVNFNEGVQFNSTFYSTITEQCKFLNNNTGVNLRSEAKGNKIIDNTFSENNVGVLVWDVATGGPASGQGTENIISHNVIENSPAATAPTFGIEVAGGARNVISFNRLECTAGTAHIGEDAGSVDVATKNEYIGNQSFGTVKSYRFGNGTGTGQSVGAKVFGGFGVDFTINSDADNIKVVAGKNDYTGTFTDNGRGSDIDVDSAGGLCYKKNPGTTDKVYKLVAGGTSTVMDFGPNYLAYNYSTLSDAYRFGVLSLGGTPTAVSRHGAYRFWVDSSGRFRIHTADPTALTDGGYFAASDKANTFTQTQTFGDSTITAPSGGSSSWTFTPGAGSDGEMFFNLATNKSLFAPTGANLGLNSSSYRWRFYGTDANLSGVLRMDGTPQTATGSGSPTAINLTTDASLIVTSGAQSFTLAAGSEGQYKTLKFKTDGGDATITVTNLLGGTTITMNDAGDFVYLRYLDGQWLVLANSGCTVS